MLAEDTYKYRYVTYIYIRRYVCVYIYISYRHCLDITKSFPLDTIHFGAEGHEAATVGGRNLRA